MRFEQCDEYLKKIYSRSVKKSKFSFSCHLQIDKNTNNVPKGKTSQLPSAYEVLVRKILFSAYHRTLFRSKEAEIDR